MEVCGREVVEPLGMISMLSVPDVCVNDG
jgi:hypothetical protein